MDTEISTYLHTTKARLKLMKFDAYGGRVSLHLKCLSGILGAI